MIGLISNKSVFYPEREKKAGAWWGTLPLRDDSVMGVSLR